MQKFLSCLFDQLMKSWSWMLLIVTAILIKWVSLYPDWVERNYTYGIYPFISRIQRIIFGWLPFSIGDLFYAFLVLVVVFRTSRFLKLLFQRKLTRRYFASGLQQAIFFFLFVYVFFNLLWGLNYNRLGIAAQLNLQVKKYTLADLDTLTTAIQVKLNHYADAANEEQRDSLNRKKRLFKESDRAYAYAVNEFSFLRYETKSIKPSLFSYLGNYLGFQGYYNPFSGESQVNTTIPRFLEPFVTTHEIAHQLGYAKENEANFVAFLACRSFPSNGFKYSMYFDMYNYAIGEVRRRDTALAKNFHQKLHLQVANDINEYRDFYRRYRNPIEPIITWGYSHYLKANNQPAGKETYNEVVAWLIAYYKKFGIAAL
ncbi:MAG: DUF3810 domain-containing protein [Chitinophagaceae bacterium]|nr:DUF3810 domain-containing protein [Chitinophagaceae bacterium]